MIAKEVAYSQGDAFSISPSLSPKRRIGTYKQ